MCQLVLLDRNLAFIYYLYLFICIFICLFFYSSYSSLAFFSLTFLKSEITRYIMLLYSIDVSVVSNVQHPVICYNKEHLFRL